jgi:HD-like signal output (HDOD) protein
MDMEVLISEKIDSLPPLPDTVLKIQDICNNPKSSARDLVAIVEKDPLLTANLLRVANSPYYGFTSKINSISHAIALFGMSTVLGFALSSAVRKNFNKIDLSPYGISTDDFANSAFKQNKLMINWYSSLPMKKSDSLVPASFINEIGKVILSDIIIEQKMKDEFLQEVLKEEDDIYSIERKFLNTSTPEITGKILYKWLMSVDMIYPIIASEKPEETDDELRLYAYAIKIARTAVGNKGEVIRNSINDALKLIDKAGFKRKDFIVAIKKIVK